MSVAWYGILVDPCIKGGCSTAWFGVKNAQVMAAIKAEDAEFDLSTVVAADVAQTDSW
jgi:hypothetical protein